MEDVYLFIGREGSNPKTRLEFYQLFVGDEYVMACYDFSSDRDLFFVKTADLFARLISQDKSSKIINWNNGQIIDIEKREFKMTGKLEDNLVSQFEETLHRRIHKHSNDEIPLDPNQYTIESRTVQ